MTRLICCEGCSRHVHASELVCPFCQREQTPMPAPPVANIPAGLSRAQRLALAAAMASQALASCAKTNETMTAAFPHYGAPLAGNMASAGRGAPAAGSGAAGRDVMITPPYGAPPPPPPLAGRVAPPIAGHPSDSEDAGPNDQDAGIHDLPPR